MKIPEHLRTGCTVKDDGKDCLCGEPMSRPCAYAYPLFSYPVEHSRALNEAYATGRPSNPKRGA